MHLILTVALSAQIGAALPPDSIRVLRQRARSAEARFERLARQLAPVAWGGTSGSRCDEIVGRFCLRFDSISKPPAAGEAGRIVDARREAVEAIRRYFSAAPAELDAAGPLARLLIRDGRTTEAVSSVGAFAALSGDTIWGDLLLGFTHHWSGGDSIAEQHFRGALGRMQDNERHDWVDLSWLLEPDERNRVRRLTAAERAEYERRFWLIADPFWITQANERWIEHVSRRIEAKLLSTVPVVTGMVRWGRDLDELTIRYGTPSTRARLGQSAPGSSLGSGTSMIEYWDTAQRAFAPIRLTRGLPGPTDPGARPLLYAATARSGYAMQRVERIIEPEHQLTEFLRSDGIVLRADAAVPISGGGVSLASALFAYDSAFANRAGVHAAATAVNDTARFTLVLRSVPRGRIVYSLELLGDSTIAARARHALDTRIAADGVALSGLLLTRPFPESASPNAFDDASLNALASLVVRRGDTLGVYAEVYRLEEHTPADITLSLEPVDGPSVLTRVGRWLGVVGAGPAPSVTWRIEAEPGMRSVALNLPLTTDATGMHELVMLVKAPGQAAVESRRRILIR